MRTQFLKLKAFHTILAIVFAFSANAFGADIFANQTPIGLFVEPLLSYEIGDMSVNYPSPLGKSSGKADGFGLGSRVGFHLYESFFVGFDGRYSIPQFKDSSVIQDAESVATNWGPLVGIQMPNIGLRVWGTVILGGELNLEKSKSFDVAFKNATGYRIGTGFRIFSVSLNLEYQQMRYDKTSLDQIGPFSTESEFSSVNLENKSWVASISFPLEF
jgi:hypothetical protein